VNPIEPNIRQQLTEYLANQISPDRLRRIEQVLDFRTRHFTVVLEDIYNWHNASAALRSCEIYGIQRIHTIENLYEFSRNTGVDLGSSKWLELQRWTEPGRNNTRNCLMSLKERGFRIVVASLRAPAEPPDALPMSAPLAFCFGTELEGLSPEAESMADLRVRLPMFGFTGSFNVSVSCALVLGSMMPRLHGSSIPWQLDPEDRANLKLEWLRKSVQHEDILVAEWLAGQGLPPDAVPALPTELPDRGRKRK